MAKVLEFQPHILATKNNAIMNMSVQVFLLHSDFISFRYTARIGMLDHKENSTEELMPVNCGVGEDS